MIQCISPLRINQNPGVNHHDQIVFPSAGDIRRKGVTQSIETILSRHGAVKQIAGIIPKPLRETGAAFPFSTVGAVSL